MNSELLITLIFAAIAGFVIFKLRSVLGRRTGHEQQPGASRFGRDDRSSEKKGDNVVPLPDRGGPERFDPDASPLDAALAQIQTLDPSFERAGFLSGGRGAFEMIVAAFAAGDLDTLHPLLATEVYDSFAEAVKNRERDGEVLETSLIGIKSAELSGAELDGQIARVEVTFVSEQVNVTKDQGGNVVDGDAKAIETITDIWTFSRDTTSRDPNWALAETATPE